MTGGTALSLDMPSLGEETSSMVVLLYSAGGKLVGVFIGIGGERHASAPWEIGEQDDDR